MNVRLKQVPPRSGHIEVPVASRRAALAGLSMYTASRKRALALQRAAWLVVNVFGPRALPGKSHVWQPPLDQEVWVELSGQWAERVGPFDQFAVHRRRPAVRAGTALLLLRDGTPVGFVKVRSDDANVLRTERRALEAFSKTPATSFEVPRPLAWGEVAQWRYLVMTPLPVAIHRPAGNAPIRPILDDMSASLADAIRRPDTTPEHWRPLHGDLTPWNLRDYGSHGLVLLDWEGVSWGPPYADAFWYDAVQRATRVSVGESGLTHTPEVKAFWLEHLGDPEPESIAANVVGLLREYPG